ALLDAKEAMPDEVARPTRNEHEDTQEGERIAGRQNVLPSGALRPVVNQGADQPARHGKEPHVEYGMPGGEERSIHPAMVGRPAIEKTSTLQPGAEGHRYPIKGQAAAGLLPLCPWGRIESDGIRMAHEHIVLLHRRPSMTPLHHRPLTDPVPGYSRLLSTRAGARPDFSAEPGALPCQR